jgi:hypothetical protein
MQSKVRGCARGRSSRKWKARSRPRSLRSAISPRIRKEHAQHRLKKVGGR